MVIAGRILSACHQHLVVRQLLGLVCNDISLSVLCHDMPDITLLGLDVIGDLVRLVLVLTVFEHRFTFPFVIQTVIYTAGIDHAAVHVHPDKLRRQGHRLVFQLTATMQKCRTVLEHDHRVVGVIMHGRSQLLFCPQCHRAKQEKNRYYMSTYAYVHYTAN